MAEGREVLVARKEQRARGVRIAKLDEAGREIQQGHGSRPRDGRETGVHVSQVEVGRLPPRVGVPSGSSSSPDA